MQSEVWRRLLLLLTALQVVLAIIIFPMSIYNATIGEGYSPALFSIASINFAVFAILNLIIAACFIRIMLKQAFFPGITFAAHGIFSLYLICILGYGGQYLGQLSLSDPWYTSADICEAMPSSYGKKCKVDKTYIAVFSFGLLLLFSHVAIACLLLVGHIRKLSIPYDRPISHIFTVLIHGKGSIPVQTSTTTQPELIHGGGNRDGQHVENKIGLPTSNVTSGAYSGAKVTGGSPIRTLWENGIEYQMVPVTNPRGLQESRN